MMFRSSRSSSVAGPCAEMVIVPHHPDRLRRPGGSVGALARDRFQQALVWNAFRTLELLPPAFWLRRLQARFSGDASLPASQIVQVHLWLPLPLPPAMRIDGRRADVVVDVVIETEHAVWTLPVYGVSDGLVEEQGEPGDKVSRIIDAGGWHAGSRRHYFGVIDAEERDTSISVGAIVIERLSRSNASVALRSGAARAAAEPGVGVLRWGGIASILHDCEQAAALSTVERALARNAVTWLERVGVRPDALSDAR